MLSSSVRLQCKVSSLTPCLWVLSGVHFKMHLSLSVQPACASQKLQCKVSSLTLQVSAGFVKLQCKVSSLTLQVLSRCHYPCLYGQNHFVTRQQILSTTYSSLIQTGVGCSLRFVGLVFRKGKLLQCFFSVGLKEWSSGPQLFEIFFSSIQKSMPSAFAQTAEKCAATTRRDPKNHTGV